MRHSKKKSSDPSVARRRGESASPVPPPTAPLGPSKPSRRLFGLARLRAVLNLTQADLDQVCEDAADEITRLRENQRPVPWRSSR